MIDVDKIAKMIVAKSKFHVNFEEGGNSLYPILQAVMRNKGLWRNERDKNKVFSVAKKNQKPKDTWFPKEVASAFLKKGKSMSIPDDVEFVILALYGTRNPNWGSNQRLIGYIYYVDQFGVKQAFRANIKHNEGIYKFAGAKPQFKRIEGIENMTEKDFDDYLKNVGLNMEKAIAESRGQTLEEYRQEMKKKNG